MKTKTKKCPAYRAPYPNHLKETALRYLRKGWSAADVASSLALRVETVRCWAHAAQISTQVRCGGAGVPVYARYRLRRREVCEMLLSNPDARPSEVARLVVLSANAVRAVAREYGILSIRERVARMRK